MGSLVSVVIPNYNRKDLLELCLNSLQAQDYKPIEIIVVDNGSTDGSPDLIKDLFPSVKQLELPKNMGFSAAVNAGIVAASGNLIALINNDAEADPKWISELAAAAGRHPEAGFFASKILFYDDRRIIDTFGDSFSKAGFGFKIGWGERDGEQFEQEKYILGACGGAALYRKLMLENLKINGEYFDNDFFAFGEDLDISLRAQLFGYKCVAVPAARVFHRVRATAGRGSQFSIFLGHRNFLFCIIKNFPRTVILRNILSIISYLSLALFWDILFKRKFTTLKSYIDAYRKRKTMLEKRLNVLSRQKVSDQEFNHLLEGNWFRKWVGLGKSSYNIRKRAL